jgi:hypothetical protein
MLSFKSEITKFRALLKLSLSFFLGLITTTEQGCSPKSLSSLALFLSDDRGVTILVWDTLFEHSWLTLNTKARQLVLKVVPYFFLHKRAQEKLTFDK